MENQHECCAPQFARRRYLRNPVDAADPISVFHRPGDSVRGAVVVGYASARYIL
jgi:hypothetical protein